MTITTITTHRAKKLVQAGEAKIVYRVECELDGGIHQVGPTFADKAQADAKAADFGGYAVIPYLLREGTQRRWQTNQQSRAGGDVLVASKFNYCTRIV